MTSERSSHDRSHGPSHHGFRPFLFTSCSEPHKVVGFEKFAVSTFCHSFFSIFLVLECICSRTRSYVFSSRYSQLLSGVFSRTVLR